MKFIPYILLLALCGCVAPRQNAETLKPETLTSAMPDLDPRHAPQAQVSRQLSVVSSGNQQGADTQAVVLPPPAPVPPSFHFSDGFLDNVWCLQSSTNLISWVNVEPNPQAPQFPVWHWGYGDGLGNVQTNLPPNTGEALVVYRWKGMPW